MKMTKSFVYRHLSVEKNRLLYVKLYPVISNLNKDQPPIASFVVRLRCSSGDCRSLVHPGNSPFNSLNFCNCFGFYVLGRIFEF